MMRPRVSILIPTYNRQELIGDCIRSAQAQTIEEIEIIIGDNASDDQTFEICQKLAGADSRLKVFQQPRNVGPVRNWISCMEKASGEYVKILFSDDLLLPNCLELMLAEISSPSVGFVYSAVAIGSSLENASTHYVYGGKRISPKTYTDLILRDKAPVSPGALLLRTEDMCRNLKPTFPTSIERHFEDHGAGPDVMIALLTASNYPHVIHLREPLVFFRIHEDSLTIKNSGNEVRDGHLAAICYFLWQAGEKRRWYGYLSRVWRKRMKATGNWISPKGFLKSFEGTGSRSELMLFLLRSSSFSLLRVLFRVTFREN